MKSLEEIFHRIFSHCLTCSQTTSSLCTQSSSWHHYLLALGGGHPANTKQISCLVVCCVVLFEGRKGMCVKFWEKKRSTSTHEDKNVSTPFPFFTLVGVKLLCLSVAQGWPGTDHFLCYQARLVWRILYCSLIFWRRCHWDKFCIFSISVNLNENNNFEHDCKTGSECGFFFCGMLSLLPVYFLPLLPIPVFSNTFLLCVECNQIVLEL